MVIADSGVSLLRAVIVPLAALLSAGASPALADDAPVHAAADKGWVDARSICLFRLGDGDMPRDSKELRTSLSDGWRHAITLPDDDKAIFIAGDTYPSLQTLRIDFSDGRLRPSKSKDKIKLNNRVEKSLLVDHLEVRGQPMLLEKARLNMRLLADDASMAMERDRQGRPVMMLSDAKSGTLSFDVSRRDAEALMLANARETASRYGVDVERMKLKIVPETPRSLQVSLYVATTFAYVPAGMLFRAHVTVDQDMNAKITGLSCEGDDVLGPIIVGLLRPTLAKFNGSTPPLVVFPAGKMHLRDVAVSVDDDLHLTAAFGR